MSCRADVLECLPPESLTSGHDSVTSWFYSQVASTLIAGGRHEQSLQYERTRCCVNPGHFEDLLQTRVKRLASRFDDLGEMI